MSDSGEQGENMISKTVLPSKLEIAPHDRDEFYLSDYGEYWT
jgi:hypothetical protein